MIAEHSSMANIYNHGDVVLRFSDVSFHYDERRPILDEVNFSMRERAKIALMGQNGSGKSTIFNLILGMCKPEEGSVNIRKGASIAIAAQVVKKADLEKNVLDFFQGAFKEKAYDIEPRAKRALDGVNMGEIKLDKLISQFSGGEQARLLLAFALVQDPDILLLDEPTNNLDKAGIEHLTKFLVEYKKTVLIISHDAQFLNSFTQGVLYLDIYKKKVDQYVGDYLKVVEEIKAQVERERRENVRLLKDISDRKEQMGFFAQKGGHMRDVARKMREAIKELEKQIVDIRHEDKTIVQFRISCPELAGPLVKISSVSIVKNLKPVSKKVAIVLKRGEALLIAGPNGIGKTTFLKTFALRTAKGVEWGDGVTVGYYAQDFSGLDEEKTVYESLLAVAKSGTEEHIRSVASRFLFTDDLLRNHVGSLSEGQKGLLCFAQFVLQEPTVLILDEPTNHVNFRHLPIIAKALDDYQGALIVVSHMAEFASQIQFNEVLDLGAL